MVARWVAFSMLVAGVACAPVSSTQAPKPLTPGDGPKASINVSYAGGLTYRTLNASVQTEQNAYILVGHLAGDGMVRVVYPESPMRSGRVQSGKRVTIRPIMSRFDGAPSLFSLGRAPFRTVSAMMDSYDGAGHGFVFVVASRSPLDFDAISDGYDWDEFSVTDYLDMSDPRHAIRAFADRVAGGARFTLRYANSYSTMAFASYASLAEDCAMLSSLGYGYANGFWGSWGLSPRLLMGRAPIYYYTGSRYGCYPSYAYSRAHWLGYDRYYGGSSITVAIGPRRPPITEPQTPVTRTLTRPTYREPNDLTRRALIRSALDRRPATATTGSGSQRWRNDDVTDRFRSRPSVPPPGASTRDYGSGGGSPGASTPRSTGSPGASAAPRAGPSSSAPTSGPAATTSTPSTKKHQ